MMSDEKETAEGPAELAARMREKHSYGVPVKDFATAMVLMRDMGRDLVEVVNALETDATVIDSLDKQLAEKNKEIERQSTQLALLQSRIAQLDRLIAKLGRDALIVKEMAKETK